MGPAAFQLGERLIGLVELLIEHSGGGEEISPAAVLGYRLARAAGKREVYNLEEEWGKLTADWVPPFRYNPEDTDFYRALWPLGYFFVAVAVVFAVGFVAFLRYDIR